MEMEMIYCLVVHDYFFLSLALQLFTMDFSHTNKLITQCVKSNEL